MLGIHNYSGFVAAILVFQIIPGPGTLTILNATARYGPRAGMGSVVGTLTADFVFMLSAVLGLAAVLAARPVILELLQWMGIVYLCGYGLSLLRKPPAEESARLSPADSFWTSFRQAFAVGLTNPKSILFFMAFFPIFLAPDSPKVTLEIMMAHVTLISLLYQTGLVLVGNLVAVRLSRFQSARTLARRVAGFGLLGFGIKLAVNRR